MDWFECADAQAIVNAAIRKSLDLCRLPKPSLSCAYNTISSAAVDENILMIREEHDQTAHISGWSVLSQFAYNIDIFAFYGSFETTIIQYTINKCPQ